MQLDILACKEKLVIALPYMDCKSCYTQIGKTLFSTSLSSKLVGIA
jgi:hypothetical protein